MEVLQYLVPIFSITVAAVGCITSFYKGRKVKKSSKNLSRAEQEKILYDYMVEEAKKTQRKSKFFAPTMNKSQVAIEKHDTVMEKVGMYARGAGYDWYDEVVWEEKLVKLLADSKELQN